MLYLATFDGAGTRRNPFRVSAAIDIGAGWVDLRPDGSKVDGCALVWGPGQSRDLTNAHKLIATKEESLGAAARALIGTRLARHFRGGTVATLTDRLNRLSNIESLIGDFFFEPDWHWNPVMCDPLGRKHVWINGDLLAFRQVAAPAPGELIDPTDTFVRADENPLASPWTNNGLANLKLASNRVQGISATDSCMYHSGAAASADHFSEVTYDADGGDQDGGPAVRITTGQNDYFSDLFIGGSACFAKHTSGTFSNIGSTPAVAWSSGDKHLLWIVGSALRTSINGSLVAGPTTDTTHASGQPGIFIFNPALTIQGWRGGDGDGSVVGGGFQAAWANDCNEVIVAANHA